MAAAGFRLRKIRTALTFGEKLQRARKRKGVNFVEAELATKVRAKYLEALEREDFDLLPNDIYTKGFIAAYANYLGLPSEKIAADYFAQKSLHKVPDEQTFVAGKAIKERALVITPKLVVISFAILFSISAVIYIILQVFSFAAVPKLVIDNPKNDAVVVEEKIIVSGWTDPGVDIKVNKEAISVNPDGRFEREIVLQNGINSIIISARNKASKETSKVFVVERKSKTAEK